MMKTGHIPCYLFLMMVASVALLSSTSVLAQGTYSLELYPRSWYYLEATAGEDNFFTITAKNNGSGELTGIKFSATKPRDWIVEFQPSEIDRLAPGSSREVEVNIKPASNGAQRYYYVTLIAEAEQAQQTTNMRVRVEEFKLTWIWVGAGIAVITIAVCIVIFRRLSRGN